MWQKLTKPTWQERSPKVIGIVLFVLSVVLLFIGTFLFPMKVYESPEISIVRDKVIKRYTQHLYENQETIDVYEMLKSIDSTLQTETKPVMKSTRFHPIPIMNMMLGIWDDSIDVSIPSLLYFFLGNIVMSFVMITLCYRIDNVFMKNSEMKGNSSVVCPQRDILLEYRNQLANGDNVDEGYQMKICSMEQPPPTDPLRSELIRPLPCLRSGLKPLFFFILIAFFLAYVVVFMKHTNAFDEFKSIIDFCNTIAPLPLYGSVLEFMVWLFMLIALVIFNYTIYSLSLMIIDIVKWSVGLKGDQIPVLID